MIGIFCQGATTERRLCKLLNAENKHSWSCWKLSFIFWNQLAKSAVLWLTMHMCNVSRFISWQFVGHLFFLPLSMRGIKYILASTILVTLWEMKTDDWSTFKNVSHKAADYKQDMLEFYGMFSLNIDKNEGLETLKVCTFLNAKSSHQLIHSGKMSK